MTETAIAIRDWDQLFENSESKKVGKANWVPLSNKHDGKGFRRLTAHENKVEVYCAWTLMVQIASRMPVRGILADKDGALTVEDMSLMTGFQQEIFTLAINVLCDQKIGWLESVPIPEQPDASERAGPEGKGREGKGTEQKGREVSLSPSGGFKIPPLPPETPLEKISEGRQRLLLQLRMIGAALKIKGEDIFHEYCGMIANYPVSWIEYLLGERRQRPMLPSEFRKMLKKFEPEYEAWCAKRDTERIARQA